jgi:hypothetical protein
MRRVLAIAAMVMTVLVPGLAAAEGLGGGPPHGGPPHGAPAHGPPPGPHGPPAGTQFHRAVGPVGGPIHVGPPGGPVHVGPGGPIHVGGPVGVGGQFTYHGHPFNRVHMVPFVYPAGYAYRRWEVGGVLPPLFLVPAYYYADWASLGLAPPPPGAQWVRYGPDLLLVDIASGQVLEVIPDAFYE